MSPTIEGAGVSLAYAQRGAPTAPPVLLVHGMASDALGLAPLAEALAPRARVVVYDRRGYGGSEAPEPYAATTIHEQAQDAAAVLRGLGLRPAIVAGAGFGALIALDLLLRHRELVCGAVLADPPLGAFAADAAEQLAAERLALEDALRAGGPEHAVEVWVGGGVSDEALARARRAHGAFFADYAGQASLPVTRAALRAIDAPVAVLTGTSAAPHIRAAADALAELLPAARRLDDGDLVAAVGSLLGDGPCTPSAPGA